MELTAKRFNPVIWLLKGAVALAIAGTAACIEVSSTAPPRPAQTIYTVPAYTTVPSETVSHNYNYTTSNSTSTSTSVSHIYVHQDINAHPGTGPVQPVTSDDSEEQRQPDAIDQGNHQAAEDQSSPQTVTEPEPPSPEEQAPREEPNASSEQPAAEPEPAKEEAPAAEPPSESPPSDSSDSTGSQQP